VVSGVTYDSLYLSIGQGGLINGLLVVWISILKGFGYEYSFYTIFGFFISIWNKGDDFMII
jgi:hypothetical protein